MKNFFKILFLMLSVSFTESTLASSGAYLAGRQAISDHNFVTASKFQAKSVSADPSNSKLLESLMISFVAQGSVGKAITVAETHKIDGNLSQISQMILSAAMIKEGQNKTLLNFLNNSDEITPILKDLLSAWILMGLDDEVNANRIFDKLRKFTLEDQIKSLEMAIIGGYKDVYEPKLQKIYKKEEPVKNHPASKVFKASEQNWPNLNIVNELSYKDDGKIS